MGRGDQFGTSACHRPPLYLVFEAEVGPGLGKVLVMRAFVERNPPGGWAKTGEGPLEGFKEELA